MGQEGPGRASLPSPDPVCGFTSGPHFYYETDLVRQGLSIDLFVGEAQVDQPVRLRLFVNQKPRSTPIDNLQVEHEKLMHVIGMREDLTEFFHIHPAKVSPGMWEVTHLFKLGGTYRIWADVKAKGVSYSFGLPPLKVSEAPMPNGSPKLIKNCATNGSYQIIRLHSGTLTTATTNRLEFSIRNASGRQVFTENFLGSPMHLVIVSEDKSVYLHAHPDTHLPGEGVIRFSQVFPKPGTYKFFAQFRPLDAKLPVNQAILAEFYAQVNPVPTAHLEGETSLQLPTEDSGSKLR